MKRFRKKDNKYIGLDLSLEEVRDRFNLVTAATLFHISPEIIFLGTVPRQMDFERASDFFIDEHGKEDTVEDDSALVCLTAKGLVVISGCAHAGICNTIEYARNVTGEKRVQAVIGGFHLRAKNEQTRLTIEYLKNLGVPKIYPSHCTSFPALVLFYQAFKINQVLTGDFFYF